MTDSHIVELLTDAIEDELNLPSQFISTLYRDDDWSFVIKLHALIESSLINTLSTVVNQGKLEKQFAWLNISDDQIGKIRFAINLELITKNQYNFIKKFSEIRNQVIHDIKNTDFSFTNYAKSLDANQKKVLKRSILNVLPTKTVDENHFWGDLKQYILASTLILIANLFGQKLKFLEQSI